MSLAIAQLGRYELLGELGRGGMAELYLARRRGAAGFEKLVAIKRILPHLAQDPHFVQLFQQEAKIASRLSHPNICPVDELDETDGELFLVMEYLEGLSWAELSAAVPASAGESLRLVGGVLSQACEGLHHAHTLHVIHRDVSPQNLFVTTNGVCKVLDFGVAKLTSDDAARTRSGVLKGKLPYMSPEQIEGATLDPRSDVWAMGVVLWEALAKKPLFDRGTDFQIWTAITEEKVPSLAPRGYPASVDDVLRSALARDRDQRFASARALGQAIRQACGALEPAEIAEVLSSHGRRKLAAKATKVSGLINATDPSIVLRAAPVVIERSRETASATVDLRSTNEPAPRRNRAPWIVIGAGAIAAVVIAVVVATCHAEPPVPVIAAVPAPVAVPAPPDATVAMTTPDAALVVVPPIGTRPHNNHHAVLHAVPVDAAAAPVGTGTFTIDASPYATIYIDDRVIGDTPLFKSALPAGPHRLRAVRKDGTTKSLEITVTADRDLNLGKLSF